MAMFFDDAVVSRNTAIIIRRILSLPVISVLSIAAVILPFSVGILVYSEFQNPLWLWMVLCAAAPLFAANMAPPALLKLLVHLYGGSPDKLSSAVMVPISEKWLGAGKTYLGFISGTITGGLIAAIQYQLITIFYPPLFLAAELRFGVVFFLGALAGLLALLGDVVKSLIKRWLGIERGELFYPWDYWDFLLAGALVMIPLYALGFAPTVSLLEAIMTLLWLLTFCAVILPVTSAIFVQLGLKKPSKR